jgi:hypothetical protein
VETLAGGDEDEGDEKGREEEMLTWHRSTVSCSRVRSLVSIWFAVTEGPAENGWLPLNLEDAGYRRGAQLLPRCTSHPWPPDARPRDPTGYL